MNYRAIILEDERKAYEILKNKINRFCKNIEIIGHEDDPEKGIALIEEQTPDIVFMDIAMPRLSGFDVLDRIENPDFELIFVTAFGDYAIQAIKYCAIGYLVKPFRNEDLVTAVHNAIKNIQSKSSLAKNNQLKINNLEEDIQKKKILVPITEGFEFIKMADIIHMQGFDGYTKIYLVDGSCITSSKNLGAYDSMLGKSEYFRPHRSYIINLNYVKTYQHDGSVKLEDGTSIPVSRNRRNDFLEALKDF